MHPIFIVPILVRDFSGWFVGTFCSNVFSFFVVCIYAISWWNHFGNYMTVLKRQYIKCWEFTPLWYIGGISRISTFNFVVDGEDLSVFFGCNWCSSQVKWLFHKTSWIMLGKYHWYVEGILPKGPYLPCVSMAGRALLAGYPWCMVIWSINVR